MDYFSHPVFSTELNIFKRIKEPSVVENLTLFELINKIKYNINVQALLTPKYDSTGNVTKEYELLKHNSICTCYNATFKDYKNLSNISSTTGLMFLDIDKFQTKHEAIEYKKSVEKLDFVVCCSLSMSRLGLHIVILVDEIYDNDDFNYKYDYVSQEFFQGKLDKIGKSLTRNVVIPYDFNIYVNYYPNALDLNNRIKKCKNYEIKEEKVIGSSCTFFQSSLNTEGTVNSYARNHKLSFKETLPDSDFSDINTPVYFPDGKMIAVLNLKQYQGLKVNDGNRHWFTGYIGIMLIYLNREALEKNEEKVAKSILSFMHSYNIKQFEPPLPFTDIRNSFYNNLKKFKAGNVNVSKYLVKQNFFWHSQCTLSSNERKSKSQTIAKAPQREKTMTKIFNAILDLKAEGNKIKQVDVIKLSGISARTVKYYWKEFKDLLS